MGECVVLQALVGVLMNECNELDGTSSMADHRYHVHSHAFLPKGYFHLAC